MNIQFFSSRKTAFLLVISIFFLFAIRSETYGQSMRPPKLAGISAVPGDLDHDGLSDEDEALKGTDPNNPDTDGDALLDGWEVKGIYGINLPALNASPLHKDIFVEMDYMERATATNILAPDSAVIQAIVDVFAAAPVSNPDGKTGINIHLEIGNKVTYDADLNPLFDEFDALKRQNFEPRKAPVYHYMIWANAYSGGTSSGYSMNIPHSNFIVTLGRWNGDRGGKNDEKIGTFIHELGHNLGLMHGGSEHVNFKPNHLSVMNYAFQISGVSKDGRRVYDYQRFPMPGLDEIDLREAEGLCHGITEKYLTVFKSPVNGKKTVLCDEAMDWNDNGQIDSVPISADLNGDTGLTELLPTPNEWASLKYNGGAVGSTISVDLLPNATKSQFKKLPFIELTEEQNRQLNSQGVSTPLRP